MRPPIDKTSNGGNAAVSESPLPAAPLREALDIMDSLSDGIAIVDSRGRITDINTAMQQLLAATPGDAVGAHVSEFFPTFEPSSLIGPAYKLSRKHGGIDAAARTADEHQVPVHITISKWSADGRNQYIFAVRDFREIRFAQKRLLQTERLAAIGETMTALAHESRNALQRMQSCLTLMRLRGDADVQALVDDMQDAQDQLQKLYEEVRSFASPVRLRIRQTDARHLLEKTWQQLRLQWAPKELELRVECSDSDISQIRVDGAKLCQVFRNLLENAIEASPPGNPVLARFEPAMFPRSSLKISLEDHGPGFDEDSTLRVFDLLFTTKDHGTGMGLSIARRIVNEHDGEIQAENASNGGARIVMVLPREPMRKRDGR